jgi:hypothetical protein
VPFNNIISRADVESFIPEDVATEVLQAAVQSSAALSLFPTVPMSSKTRRMPVLSALPVAYFVNGDTGLKQTTEMAWGGKYLEAEEIAVIVPVPEAVLDDADFDIWGQVQPRLAEAVGRTLDAAIFLGTNKPATWPTGIVPAAIAAGNLYERGTNAAAAGGIAADVSALFSTVESDGYVVSGLWPAAATAEAIAGDFSQGILGIRQDLTYKLLDQAVITDDTGLVIYNLPQQDMVALRVVARYGFQVANAMTWENTNDATRYPWAVMQNATP